jgi:hypothetical protein
MSNEMNAYIGKRTPSASPSFDGVVLSFNVDEDDTTVIDLRTTIMQREADGLAPLKFTLAWREKARKAGVKTAIEVYPGCIMIVGEKSAGGQKENVSSAFEAFCDARPDVIKQ